jgi:hypothetical protein
MFPDVGDREPHGRTGLILLGGHSISLPDRFAYTVHIYNFVRDFIRAFLRIFPWGGGGFFEKGLSVSGRYISGGLAMWPTYHA